MQRINFDIKETQGLVLAPTRELAQQIQKVVVALGDYLDVGVRSLNLVPTRQPLWLIMRSNNCASVQINVHV